MISIGDAKAALATIEGILAKNGSGLTFNNVGAAVQDGLNKLKSLTLADAASAAETVGLDLAEDVIPGLKVGVDIFKFVQSLPGYAPADWNSPVRLAREDEESPYADSEREAAAKLGAGT